MWTRDATIMLTKMDLLAPWDLNFFWYGAAPSGY
jgi:hypothetical protein